MDDEIRTDEILDDAMSRGEPPQRRSGRLEDWCDLWRLQGCCESASLIDGGCLVGLTSLTGVGGGLFAAFAGTGHIGRRLRNEKPVPRGLLAAALHRGVRYYQLRISARRSGYGGCRYTPTCSAYAVESLRRHGALKGTRLAVGRLRRCRPGTVGGVDLVP